MQAMRKNPVIRITCIGLAVLCVFGCGILISMFNRGVKAQTDVPLLAEFGELILQKRAAGEIPKDERSLAAKLQKIGDVDWKDPYSGIRPIIRRASRNQDRIVVEIDIEERRYRLEVGGDTYDYERIPRSPAD